MATIRPLDMRLIEDAFGMSGGYVLDFSNRSFAQFFRHEAGVAIYHDRYAANGNSKANRLRTFLNIASDALAGRVLRALWEYRDATSPSPANDDRARKEQDRFFQMVHALDGKGAPPKAQAAAPPPGPAAPSPQTLADLNRRLLDLTAMQPQARGFAFESFLSGLFGAYQLDPRRSFRLVGEQIDGSFEIPPDTYLLEAKWQTTPSGFAELASFAAKVDGKSQWARGLFVSYSGFSPDGLQAFARGRPTSIVGMDGLDLAQILSGSLSLLEVIQRKKRRAVETGHAFVPVRDLFFSVT
jgi:hypothetical protein